MLQILLLIVTLWVSGTVSQCPPADLLSPCRCESDDSTSRVFCKGNVDNADNIFDLKEIFDRVSSTVDQSHIFDSLEISAVDNEEIPEGTVQTLKFKGITISSNPNLRFIHPNALNETLKVTTSLSISGNAKLSNGPSEENEYDVFNFINQLTNLGYLSVVSNDIHSIPDKALGPHPNLGAFRFDSGESLTYLGSEAFSKWPKVQWIDLSYNDLSLDEFAQDTFQGIAESAVVDLEHNPITRLPSAIFKPLLDTANKLYVGGLTCSWNCPYLKLDCDEVSDWICEDVPRYQPKLEGFYCQETSGFWDIFEYCANKNMTMINLTNN